MTAERPDAGGSVPPVAAVTSLVTAGDLTRDDAMLALLLIRGCRRQVDELELAAIDAARRAGVSWDEIASSLHYEDGAGNFHAYTTRQGVHKRRRHLLGRQQLDPSSAKLIETYGYEDRWSRWQARMEGPDDGNE